MNNIKLSCFKAYDIRGKVGSQLNEEIAYRIGRAYGQYLQAKNIVLGGDIRQSTEALKGAVANGLMDAGVNVIDLGMTGSEEVYYAAFSMNVDGGIEVTASHNPINYNGIKPVGKGAVPIGKNSGLKEIQALAENSDFEEVKTKGTLLRVDNRPNYINHILSYIDLRNIKPLRLVMNSGNGSAGPVIDEIEKRLKAQNVPLEFIKIHHKPDGSFPNGTPNPILPENRIATSKAVIEYKADMGLAWDGDFDRCFLFDEKGCFIEGYYIVGLLAKAFLKKGSNQKILFDPRVYWNTKQIITENDGTPVLSESGHAPIKARMRKENAVYGGEMSAHHYFRDFAYCDSGMIPWLLITELLSVNRVKLSALVGNMIDAYPTSGEVNFKLSNPKAAIKRVKELYTPIARRIEKVDGLGMEFIENNINWRFNIRTSNTEPVVRLNIESRGSRDLVNKKLEELFTLLTSCT